MATKKESSRGQTRTKSASASGRRATASKESAGGTRSRSGEGSSRSQIRSGASSSRSQTRSGSGSARNQTRSRTTTDHEEIRSWAEDRGAHPACVRGTGGRGDLGMLRLDFPGYSGKPNLQEISWDEFFEKFDERGLALLYQETTARGQKSNFNKIVSRETAEEKPKTRAAH